MALNVKRNWSLKEQKLLKMHENIREMRRCRADHDNIRRRGMEAYNEGRWRRFEVGKFQFQFLGILSVNDKNDVERDENKVARISQEFLKLLTFFTREMRLQLKNLVILSAQAEWDLDWKNEELSLTSLFHSPSV